MLMLLPSYLLLRITSRNESPFMSAMDTVPTACPGKLLRFVFENPDDEPQYTYVSVEYFESSKNPP